MPSTDSNRVIPEITQKEVAEENIVAAVDIISRASIGCTDFDRVIPEITQKVVILSDEDFDEVVIADLQLIKQVWADMEKGGKPFTPIISKIQRKKNKQLVRSGGKPYNIRSRGGTSHRSL
ncbi:hypothetical protein TSUD_242860 [Trifolium subterraneum]|uniref:Uncharacterized protein n=1 Tax=Trifolium subterraneum TaxID=3900 RepID=A0A2Z6NUP1_TRISU|nr:hypothetical protein TSUD_242860 [Trifolium subterraneum]